jgi:hypothetical protein
MDDKVKCLSVIEDELWIYWTLALITTNNYDSLTDLHTP